MSGVPELPAEAVETVLDGYRLRHYLPAGKQLSWGAEQESDALVEILQAAYPAMRQSMGERVP